MELSYISGSCFHLYTLLGFVTNQIQRIQYLSRYKQYSAQRAAVAKKLGMAENQVERVPLWHGTAEDTLRKILKTYFNRSYAGSANGDYQFQMPIDKLSSLYTILSNSCVKVLIFSASLHTSVSDDTLYSHTLLQPLLLEPGITLPGTPRTQLRIGTRNRMHLDTSLCCKLVSLSENRNRVAVV